MFLFLFTNFEIGAAFLSGGGGGVGGSMMSIILLGVFSALTFTGLITFFLEPDIL